MIKNLCWELFDDDPFWDRIYRRQEAQPAQPSSGQDHRIDFCLSYPLDSCLDIPSNRYYLQLEAPLRCPIDHLHRATRCTGADPGSVEQIIELAAHQDIPGVLTHRNGDDLQILCCRGRKILQGVHREIDLISTERIAYRAHEDAGAADLGELALIKITGCG